VRLRLLLSLWLLASSGGDTKGRQTRADDKKLRQLSPGRVHEEAGQILEHLRPEEGRVAVRKLVYLAYHGLVDFVMAVAQAGHSSAAGGVQELLAVFQEDVASFAADGFFGNEARIPVEDCAVGGLVCVQVSSSYLTVRTGIPEEVIVRVERNRLQRVVATRQETQGDQLRAARRTSPAFVESEGGNAGICSSACRGRNPSLSLGHTADGLRPDAKSLSLLLIEGGSAFPAEIRGSSCERRV
jgi:hypothetical protein